jgi:hypothetical protein
MTFWSRQLSILLALSLAHHVKRQTGTVPDACYTACSKSNTHSIGLEIISAPLLNANSTSEDNVGIQAQAIGKVPALCDTGGRFELALADCTQCLLDNSGAGNTTQISQLDQYITYCDEQTSDEFASAQSVLASASSVAVALSRSSASLASVEASAESAIGITASSSTQKMSTVPSPTSSRKAILMQT